MAAVTPVGSQIYVNQASPLVSQIHQSVAQRFDMQAFVVAEAEKNKEAKIEPVSEADGTHKINADGDNGKNNEQYRPEKEKKEEDEEAEEPHKSDHILDLKV